MPCSPAHVLPHACQLCVCPYLLLPGTTIEILGLLKPPPEGAKPEAQEAGAATEGGAPQEGEGAGKQGEAQPEGGEQPALQQNPQPAQPQEQALQQAQDGQAQQGEPQGGEQQQQQQQQQQEGQAPLPPPPEGGVLFYASKEAILKDIQFRCVPYAPLHTIRSLSVGWLSSGMLPRCSKFWYSIGVCNGSCA